MHRRDTLPVIDPADFPEGDEERPDATVHGVVLAAGASTRFGEKNKLLEPIDGNPLVYHASQTLLEANLRGITVVVGHEADRIRDALTDLDVEVRHNEDYADGQSTSMAAGVAAARAANADAVLFALADMPTVSVETIDLLVRAYRRGVGTALAAACDGQRGNPVLFDGRYFDDLGDVDGDVGGREILLEGDDSVAVETDDSGVLYDVDHPSDL